MTNSLLFNLASIHALRGNEKHIRV